MAIKKIVINKNDEPTFIVEQVLDAEADEITLAVPRFSKFGASISNFKLLKREGGALGKRIFIESVDDQVIDLAKSAGLECINPFFGASAKQFSDIVNSRRESAEQRAHTGNAPREHRSHNDHDLNERHDEERQRVSDEPPARRHKTSHRRPSMPHAFRMVVIIPIIIGFAVLGWFLGARVLPRADITLAAQRTNWSHSGAVLVDTSASAIDAVSGVLPGERFNEKKNIQLSFPASGKKQVSEKASGTITIFNAHSSSPQGLVKSTRFLTSDGKLFRLVESITVPGAKIEDGKIVPSSIDAKVIADKAGSEYNIGPVSKLTIPGFSGTPKAETFYGASSGAMTGGFVGEVAYPSSADLKAAEATIAETLRTSMRELIRAKLPKEFTVVDGAERFKILETKIDSQASTDAKFALFAEGESSLMAFRESDLVAMFNERILSETGGVTFDVKKYTATYNKASFDLTGRLVVPVAYEVELARTLDLALVKSKIRGRAENELRPLIFSLPGIESARISLWPFWVRRVPADVEKIRIAVD